MLPLRQMDQALIAAQHALTYATAQGDAVLDELANHALGTTYWVQGEYRHAIDCFSRSVAAWDGARRYERYGQSFLPAVNARSMLAAAHVELGTFAQGQAYGEEGLQIAEVVGHPASCMLASWGLGMLALRQEALGRALSQFEQALSLCQEADLPMYFPRIAAALGAAYILAGRVGEAVPLLTRAMAQTREPEVVGFETLCPLALGEALGLADRVAEAHVLAERALALAQAHQERDQQAYALRLLGEIAARREPPEHGQAEAHYQQALALANELGMRPLQAHCHRGLGTLYAATGQREQARAALTTAIEMYRVLDMTFWLPQAEAAQAQVEE
jgi:tetratricopeptide (TPR) repeat protein